jgi:ADP-ribose pyrophosphatase YjhB (NUDIX family)
MRVNVHAVVLDEGRLLVHRERRRDGTRLSLPGGRVKQREALADALVREVREETGLVVEPGSLLYVAEANASPRDHTLILAFAADVAEQLPDADPHYMALAAEDLLLPPILAEIRRDGGRDWAGAPRWLGDIWDATLGRR